jgi:hypothetical protein
MSARASNKNSFFMKKGVFVVAKIKKTALLRAVKKKKLHYLII